MKKLLLVLAIFLTLSGCSKAEPQSVAIADQYGTAYAPLEVMKALGLLEKQLPKEYTVSWVKLGNTVGIREAMIAGDVDIGFMGIPPFLIGHDKGMPWKIMTGLSESPLGLVTNEPQVKNLKDLVGMGKIALPQPGSIQHILLAMASERELGDASLFDHQLISLKHPDGYQALVAQTDVVAHFTAPPFLTKELQLPKMHQLLTGEEAFGGPFTFIVGVCQRNVYEDQVLYKGFQKALEEAMIYMEDYPKETVALLSKAYDMTPEAVEAELKLEGLHFSKEVKGLESFSKFMVKTGYLGQMPTISELLWQP